MKSLGWEFHIEKSDFWWSKRFLSENACWYSMYRFGRKKKCRKKTSKVLLMQLQHTLFMYKWRIWMLLQIIHAVLMKGWTEAALIALSIFFLWIFFFFHLFIIKKTLRNHKIQSPDDWAQPYPGYATILEYAFYI